MRLPAAYGACSLSPGRWTVFLNHDKTHGSTRRNRLLGTR
jgi:hypothetical protein